MHFLNAVVHFVFCLCNTTTNNFCNKDQEKDDDKRGSPQGLCWILVQECSYSYDHYGRDEPVYIFKEVVVVIVGEDIGSPVA